MKRWISLIVLSACGVALAATGPTTQPAAPPSVSAAPPAPSAWAPYSNGRQSRRGENNRSRRGNEFSEPTSRPGDPNIPNSGPLPQEFDILNYRNIFYRGHLPSPDSENRPRQETISSIHDPETSLMFNGVTITNGKPTVFLENTDEGTVLQLHVGDAVARGKIVGIALDSLEYQLTGQATSTHVQIGQNLAGSNLWGTLATSQPASTGNASTDAILEKLKAKRAAELSGK